MRRPRILFLCLTLLLALALVGCASYTYNDAKDRIEPVASIPAEPPVPTRMSDIQAIRDAEQAILDAETAEREVEAAAQAAEEAKRMEAEQAEKVQRLAAEAEAHRIAAEKAAQEEAKRKAEEEAARIAAEEAAKLVAPVPDADKLTYPYQYRPLKEERRLEGPVLKFSSLLIPLPDNRLQKEEAVRLAQEIASSVSDIDLPVLFVTGDMQNIVTLVNQLRRDAVIVPEGAIVTSFPISAIGENSVTVTPQNGKQVQLLLAYTPEYQVIEAFLANPGSTDWKPVAEERKEERAQQVKDLLAETSATTPVLVGASFFEPSYLDWTSFTPITYRSAYDWPLSMLMEDEQFLDGYRTTHYSEETSAGTTIRWNNENIDLQERIDYLYSRKLLPMETTMLSLGGLSAPADQQAPKRYALMGTYILP